MNIQVASSQPFTQLPVNRPATEKSQADQVSAQASSHDSVSIGRGLLSVASGTGAGLLGGGVAATALALIAEKGLSKDFGGYVAVGGALGGAAALAGATASTLFTDNPTTGAVAGAITGGIAAGAMLGKTLGNVNAAALGAAIGIVGGGIGGYVAAKIKH